MANDALLEPQAAAVSGPGALVPGREIAFARWATRALLLTLGVVLFGAVVRVTGSGAGCGQHWPTCNGQIAHLPRRLETAIELGHRTSSGIALFAVVALVPLAFRSFGRGHPVRTASAVAALMMGVEALLGAALVLFGLVDRDASLGRALLMPLHLVTTSLLSAALALAAFFALPAATAPADASPLLRRVGLGALGFLLVSSVGALTALGDTLFPPAGASLAARWSEDQAASAHFLERLRIVHPLSAAALAVFLFHVAAFAESRAAGPAVAGYARALRWLTVIQMAAGVANVLLSAPGWMQLVHLLLASLLWLVLVLLGAECAAPRLTGAPRAALASALRLRHG